MFDTVRKEVNLLEQVANEMNQAIVECGTNVYKFEDDETIGCFACEHHDCLKFFYDEGEPEKATYHCFSCSAHGNVIDFMVWKHSVTPKEAALMLVKEHDLKLSSSYNPIAEIFQLAAVYYHNCLLENSTKYAELSGKTPLEYQLEVRKHKQETLVHWGVGWSDGSLISYLESLGYDEEILNSTGLRSQKTGRDFLPSKVFIYPHVVKGKVSHLTFKDPTKRLAYQLPGKYSLNGWEFYGQDTIKEAKQVIIIEGENDLLSVWGARNPAVLATIGQISSAQLEWMKENLGEKDVVTFYDPDDAGDKYRAKTEKLRRWFNSLTQIRPVGDDIDKLLSDGKTLDEIIKESKDAQLPVEEASSGTGSFNPDKYASALEDDGSDVGSGVEPAKRTNVGKDDVGEDDISVKDIATSNIIQKKGCYWKVGFKADDVTYTKISDFTMLLKNIYIPEEGGPQREVVIIREDGKKSKPTLVDSDTKVKLLPFRVMLANAVDASFTGSEKDMCGIWDMVYANSSETEVQVTRTVGRHEGMKGWIFRNKFISDSGMVVEPDKEGVFWIHGKTLGIRPESLNVASNKPGGSEEGTLTKNDIPRIEPDVSKEEAEELMKQVVFNLAKNLNNPGQALIMLGWIYANIFSNNIFSLNKSFPFLFLWGTKGKGKTSIVKWLQCFYDMDECGYTSVPQLKSAVGWGRKVEYYSSLPVFIDEVRSDRETEEYISLFRSYYDRTPRTMGVRDGFGVKTQQVRSCFIFVGEDLFQDPAARERCIPIRIPVNNRELTDSYRWLEEHRHLFSGITYQWILESTNDNISVLKQEIRELDKRLVSEAHCSQRTSKNWAAIGVFAKRLAAKYMPNYDFDKYLFAASSEEAVYQKSDTTIMQFFETVNAMQAQENPRINHNHIMAEGKYIHIWFPAVFKAVLDDSRGRFPFSKNAVLSAIREEPYFVSDEKKIKMGLNGVRRIVLTLDAELAPDEVKNMAKLNE
jgi:5S rRNA maturation endonuclease (ribonuclease M5)